MSATTTYPAGSPQAAALDAAGFADPTQATVTANGQSFGPLLGSTAAPTPSAPAGQVAAAGAASWLSQLQPASWRGLYFAVMDSEVRRGRRVAIHEYPYRNVVWVEDLGLATRRYGFRGFYVGDDCFQHEKAMLAAAEQAGPGTLWHPSLGALQVTLVEFSAGQRRELGRVIEYQFGFIEGSPARLFPAAASATQSQVQAAAADASAAVQGDVSDTVISVARSGLTLAGQAITATGAFVSLGLGIISDAARLVHSVNGLSALLSPASGLQLGRYSGGNIISGPAAPIAAVIAAVSATASNVERIEQGAAAAINSAIGLGQAAGAAGAVLGTEATQLGAGQTTPYVTALQAFTGAVAAACNDPADAVRALSALAAFDTAPIAGTTVIAAAREDLRQTVTAACRRAALAELARACAAYQPTSYDDAVATQTAVTALFDSEILLAADAADRRSYLAFKALRTQVVLDLVARGAALPPLTTVHRRVSLPALVLAYQLYGDATRTAELVAGAGTVPASAFMPLTFPALAR